MASDLQQVLDSIPGLVKDKNADALVALRDHDDKKVRKAVRKALHTLKSRGVTIPDGPAKAWTAGDVNQELRGEMADGGGPIGALSPRLVSIALIARDNNNSTRLSP